ncbi:hypothetical protein A2763_01085 [Candidatus Kaiserbacteria bacterium RIFCSPHIGHO2_01_FULL_54_36]|uniref:Uncharacterized protein n=1 Tax=Candidatus Kaiserbacteria bacterium RIFCSPHIGHO2_01_FULL_54_36 TaxID=1798482 RepID=A0A1F6CM79_9BACT|nr:MAG: hypothetical protein A2763_01085 [Candidatus Kaiserbacteria bacterium RIFCSPHIGHO2_01_FULL_54_36]OGG75806.1 MAG: hypothetical protein A3A41_04145 [Candidatus Kaiserbacteria bacterium RIFCSPLOWO2_01_FULL_54_22]
MEGSNIPEEFQRRVKPLSQAERQKQDKSAFVGSFDEAKNVVSDRGFDYPIIVVPQGMEAGGHMYVATNQDDLEKFVPQAFEDSLHGNIHVISRRGSTLKSGKQPFIG